MSEPLSDPVIACDNAIAHYTTIEQNALAEAAKARRKAQEWEEEANQAVANVDRWVQAKGRLTNTKHPTYRGEQAFQDLAFQDLVALARQLHDEFQRACRVHGMTNGDSQWISLKGDQKRVWRSLAAFVTGHNATSTTVDLKTATDERIREILAECKRTLVPMVFVSDRTDIPRSAYEVWHAEHPRTSASGRADWENLSNSEKARWHAITETVKECLVNQGWVKARPDHLIVEGVSYRKELRDQ